MIDYTAQAMKNLKTAEAMTAFSHDKYNLQTAQVYATLQLAQQQEIANLLTAAQLLEFPVDRATLMTEAARILGINTIDQGPDQDGLPGISATP